MYYLFFNDLLTIALHLNEDLWLRFEKCCFCLSCCIPEQKGRKYLKIRLIFVSLYTFSQNIVKCVC